MINIIAFSNSFVIKWQRKKNFKVLIMLADNLKLSTGKIQKQQ